MRHSPMIAAMLAATLLSACTEPNGAPGRGIENGGSISKTDVGTALGAVGGGVLGSTIGGGAGRTVAIIGGGLLGGLLGHEVGQSLDNADRAQYDRASQAALDSGRTRSWKNTANGHRGTVHPHKKYQNAEGRECREYTQTIYIDGKSHQGRGTACRQEDGTWRISE